MTEQRILKLMINNIVVGSWRIGDNHSFKLLELKYSTNKVLEDKLEKITMLYEELGSDD